MIMRGTDIAFDHRGNDVKAPVFWIDGCDTFCHGVESLETTVTDAAPSGPVVVMSDDYWNLVSGYAHGCKKAITRRKKDSNSIAKVLFGGPEGSIVDDICGTAWDIPVFDDAFTRCETLEECRDAAEDYVMREVDFESFPTAHELIFRFRSKPWKILVNLEWEHGTLNHVDADRAYRHELSPQEKGSVETLWDIFGGDEDKDGFRVLDERVGVFLWDSYPAGVTNTIAHRLKEKKFSLRAVTFGKLF